MLTDTNDFKVKEDRFGNLTLKFTKQTTFEKGDNIFISTEFKARRTELLEEIMIEIEIMRGHEDDKIGYLPLYKFLDKL